MASQHCDGRRRRRHSPNRGRRLWYAYWRTNRFNRRLSIVGGHTPSVEGFVAYYSTQLMIAYNYDGTDRRHG